MINNSDFREISHAGGKITFNISYDDRGYSRYQVTVSSMRPVPTVMIGVYSLPQGMPISSLDLTSWSDPPIPGCIPVLIQSDSEGRFGHLCPRCNGYWRSGPWANICPYCAFHAEEFNFLSEAQLRFVQHYCHTLNKALDGKKCEVIIDMDVVADAAGSKGEKPAFYISEESQQCRFNCLACGEFNDILGRFGYCSKCGTRNDLADFKKTVGINIRTRLNSGTSPNDCVRDAVSAFDSFTAQYAKQLAELVPMTPARLNRLTKKRFHDLSDTTKIFLNWFDIDICKGISEDQYNNLIKLFYRRHVYEHNGGEVDQKYIDDSGDTTVKIKQAIYESSETAHNLIGLVLRMAINIHNGFHSLFPPNKFAIDDFSKDAKNLLKEQPIQDQPNAYD